ncbi:hypothetical protein FB45DRAFT_916292 [Roridomyces roridus]|uniref:Uncharacterized protein n=1 Tax=Roridomyces roridus TaxID=1738132 RepID=A0AAD7BV12_9AGAR|nr:hypothetical protein FB45DRAFT_916292 [Roridomyces roridus]
MSTLVLRYVILFLNGTAAVQIYLPSFLLSTRDRESRKVRVSLLLMTSTLLLALRRQRLPLASWTARRLVSTNNVVRDPMTGELMPATPDIQPNQLKITRNTNPATPPPSQTLVFGHTAYNLPSLTKDMHRQTTC